MASRHTSLVCHCPGQHKPSSNCLANFTSHSTPALDVSCATSTSRSNSSSTSCGARASSRICCHNTGPGVHPGSGRDSVNSHCCSNSYDWIIWSDANANKLCSCTGPLCTTTGPGPGPTSEYRPTRNVANCECCCCSRGRTATSWCTGPTTRNPPRLCVCQWD